MKKNIIKLSLCSVFIGVSCTDADPHWDSAASITITEQEVTNTNEETNPAPTSSGSFTSTTLDTTTSSDTSSDNGNITTSELSETTIETVTSGEVIVETTTSGEIIDSTSDTLAESSTSGPLPVYCGNGVHEINEECDDGNIIDDDNCSNECILPRTVFLTADYIGLNNFGGIKIADSYCQNDARKFNISGIFKAWLSDDNPNNDPLIRFNSINFLGWYKTVPIKTMDMISLPIAKGWNGLSQLSNPINITSSGVIDTKTTRVWTATQTNGKKSNNTSTCSNWTMLMDNQTITGNPQVTNDNWTNGAGALCSGMSGGGKLYCFQVE